MSVDTGVGRFGIQRFELALPNNYTSLMVRIPQALFSPLTQLVRKRQGRRLFRIAGQRV